MTENNKKQALVPEGARVLDNDNGTAPGLILESGEKCMILLPGPPNEMKPLFEAQVKPFLKALNPCILYSRTVKLCGIGESKAAAMVQDMIDTQENPTIAPYAKTGEVHFRVTAQAQNEKEGKKLVKPVVKELKHRFGPVSYTHLKEDELRCTECISDGDGHSGAGYGLCIASHIDKELRTELFSQRSDYRSDEQRCEKSLRHGTEGVDTISFCGKNNIFPFQKIKKRVFLFHLNFLLVHLHLTRQVNEAKIAQIRK